MKQKSVKSALMHVQIANCVNQNINNTIMSKKNTNSKKFKPVYTVDITQCKDEHDVALAFALAKQNAGVPLSNANFEVICATAVDEFANYLDELGYIKKTNNHIEPIINTVCICNTEKPKKQNIFKRFWNWLKNAFNR